MTVFISYARANQQAAEQLRADIERCHRQAWADRELTGGQSWWRTILAHIRECDVFLVALSPHWIYSKACNLELRYALALGRPVLPVMVARTDPRLAPPVVADAQIVDYLQRSADATFALRDALDALPAARPLPAPLPPEPAAPISYLHNIILMLDVPALDPRNQQVLWDQLRSALDDADDDEARAELLTVARRFRRRRDLMPQLYRDIDEVLGPPTAPGERTVPPGTAAVWHPPTRVLPVPVLEPPPPRRSRRWLIWAAAPVTATLVVLSAWIAVADRDGQDPSDPATTTSPSAPTTKPPADPGGGGGPSKPATFTMPNLHGRGQHDALAALHGVGWQGRHGVDTLETGDRDNADVVMAQHPEQGAVVSVHITVTLTIGQLTDPGGSGPSSSSSAEPVPEKETSPEQLPPPEDSE